ncbi:MAG: EamA family transporter [Oscillospiraceae bacterium]|nr:EamA family transporter [Oscillospiraceae bacterium]
MYILLVLLTAFMSAVSQILLNISSTKKHKNFIFEYLNPNVILSYFILFCTLALNIVALQHLEVKTVNAVGAACYFFLLVLSHIFLKEKVGKKKLIGNVLIIAGIVIFVVI